MACNARQSPKRQRGEQSLALAWLLSLDCASGFVPVSPRRVQPFPAANLTGILQRASYNLAKGFRYTADRIDRRIVRLAGLQSRQGRAVHAGAGGDLSQG